MECIFFFVLVIFRCSIPIYSVFVCVCTSFVCCANAVEICCGPRERERVSNVCAYLWVLRHTQSNTICVGFIYDLQTLFGFFFLQESICTHNEGRRSKWCGTSALYCLEVILRMKKLWEFSNYGQKKEKRTTTTTTNVALLTNNTKSIHIAHTDISKMGKSKMIENEVNNNKKKRNDWRRPSMWIFFPFLSIYSSRGLLGLCGFFSSPVLLLLLLLFFSVIVSRSRLHHNIHAKYLNWCVHIWYTQFVCNTLFALRNIKTHSTSNYNLDH